MAVAGERRRFRSKLLWATVAQASSSVTNLSLYVGILLSTDTESLGRWVAVLGVYHLALALSRSLVSEPMVANDRPGDGAGVGDPAFSWPWARRRHRAIGCGAMLGVGLVGWLVEADAVTVLLVALAVPVLIGQDGARNLAWARHRPDLTVAIDLAWLAVTGTALAGLVGLGEVRPVAVIWAWVGGGLVSAVVGAGLVGRSAALAGAPDHGAVGDSAGGLTGSDPGPVGAGGGLTVLAGGSDPGVVGESAGGLTGSAGKSAGQPRGAGGATEADRARERRLHDRRNSHGLLVASRNLLPIAVALVVGPAPAGLLKASLLPFTPTLTLFAGLRLAVLPAMQRAADSGIDADGALGPRPLQRFVSRLLGWYAAAAVVAVSVTILAVSTLSNRFDGGDPIEPHVLRWGGVVAAVTILVRPLAEAVALEPSTVPAVRRRLYEVGAEWVGVFGVAVLVGADRVVVGWAIGMAIGGLVWVRAALAAPSPAQSGTDPRSSRAESLRR